jgi:hypothetical protein
MSLSTILSALKTISSSASSVLKFNDEYQAKGRSLKTYPETLQKIYGRLNIQGLIDCNSIDLSDIFIEQTVMEYLNGESEQDRQKPNL